MTSHRTKSSKMQATTKEKKRDLASSCKEKLHSRPSDKSALPLLKKTVYMDMKHGKQAKTLEEQLRKLGATIEKFLSRDVNYVISSFCPINMRQEERPSTGEDNPQSPSFVPSPFSCGPSPTTTSSDPKKNLVSRGKALAQIACAKNQMASTVISSAEKLGIKVVSVEVATKWLDKEFKKIEGCKDIKENAQEKLKKIVKKRKKLLKGAYIKFEACNRMYRPIKSELDRWPKLNPSAPPGLNPFTEVKMKMPHKMVNVRRQLMMKNKRTAYGGALSSKVKVKKSCSKFSGKDSGMIKSVQVLPDLVGVPITTAGDVKRNMENHWKRRPDKLQGYCECCEEKYKDLNQHLNDDRHRVYARNKSNYESLDALISEISPPADFLRNLLLQHCSQKQSESFQKCDDNQLKDALPALCLNVASPISSLQTGTISQEDIAALDLCTPQLDQDGSSDARLISESVSKEGDEKSDRRPQAVVIRRPTASGIFTSPRRRQPTPSKKPWVQERCMVFRDSPMASLQPSNAASQIHFKVSEHILKNPYPESIFTMGESKPERWGEQLCEQKHSVDFKEELITSSLHRTKSSLKADDVKSSKNSGSRPILGDTRCQSNLYAADGSNEPDMSEHKPLSRTVDSAGFPNGHEALQDDGKQESTAMQTLQEIQNLSAEKDITVPCIADRVKTRTRKNLSEEKHEDGGQQLPLTVTVCGASQEKSDIVLQKIKNATSTEFDTISSGKSRQEEVSNMQAKLKMGHEKETCALDQLNGGKLEEIPCKVHERSRKGNDNELCVISSNPAATSKESGLDYHSKDLKTPLNKSGEDCHALVLPKESGDHCSEKQTGHIDKDNTNSESVDNDSKGLAIRQQKSKRKTMNRAHSIDSSNQTFQEQNPNGVNFRGEHFKKDLNTTPVRNRNCSKNVNSTVADNDGLGTKEDRLQDLTEEERKPADQNEFSSLSGCVANSLRENVRQCRYFGHEGMYKESKIIISNDAGKKCLNRSLKKIDCPEIKYTGQEAKSVEDADVEDSTVDDGQGCETKTTKTTKHMSRKKSKRKSYEKKIRRSVDWNQKGETCDELNSAEERVVSPSNLIVPNIAERVKRRRSCTHFNHEGQYANGGEGIEENTPKLVKKINKYRRFLKARRRLLKNMNQRRTRMSDGSQITFPSSEQSEGKIKSVNKPVMTLSAGKNKVSTTSNAVVIRRSRSSFNALSKTDTNWSKCISDKDWSQCETESDDLPSPSNASRIDISKALPQGCQSQTSSTTEEHRDQIKLGEENMEKIETVNDTSNQAGGEEKGAIDGIRRRRRSLLIQKAVEALQLKQKKSPSQVCLLSNINVTRSPRLRLKIQRNPVDESYSSTLEEIHDSVPRGVDSSCRSPNPDISVKERERNICSSNRDPVGLSDEQHAPLPTTPQKQKILSLRQEDHSVSDSNKDALKVQRQDNRKSHFIADDPKGDSVSETSHKDELSGLKSMSERLKRQSSHSSKRKGKTKVEDKDRHLKMSQHDSTDLNAEEVKKGQEVGMTNLTTDPLLSVDKNRSLHGKSREDRQGGQELQANNLCCTGVDNSCLEGNVSKHVNVHSRKKVTSKEMKSPKPAKQHSKRRHVSREDLTEGEDSQRPTKKNKLSGKVTSADNTGGCSDEDDRDLTHVNEAVSKKLFAKDVSSHNPESHTSEVDFPKIHTEKRRESRAKIKLLWKDSGPSAQTTHRSRGSSVNQGHNEEPHGDSQEENTQTSLDANIGDILAFVPTFSSPGKTNSSWDDACDSYLNTSTKSDFPSTNQHTPLPTTFSPTPLSPNDAQSASAFVRSPALKSPRKTNKGYFSDVFGQFTSPTKRKPAGTDHLEGSPVIEKVDSVISFNHMSPQRLQFSPMKCEKSVCHRRNLNSPSKKF